MWSSRFEIRIIAAALLALVIVSLGAINLREQYRYRLPDDGVFWVESGKHLTARDVTPASGASTAGAMPGDILVGINGRAIAKAADVSREIFRLGIGGHARYQVLRDGEPLELDVVLDAQARPTAVIGSLRVVGWIYLLMGLFVLFRRVTAPRAIHFYLFCLASFVLFVFSYTGKLNTFDWIVYWSNAAALLLQPALFAHFCLAYPSAQVQPDMVERHNAATFRGWGRKGLLLSIYGSAAALAAFHLGVALGILRFSVPLVEVRWLLDRIEVGYLILMYLLGIGLLALECQRTKSPLVRKQMVWVLAGSLFAVIPFAAFYGVPYLMGTNPGPWMNLAALSLAILPLTFAYAIVHYRLLDVDIVLERGVAYTLATALLAGAYFGIAALAGDLFRSSFPAAGTIGMILAVIATGLLFQPLQHWIQRKLQRHFLPKRYDYREALLNFGREMSSETDIDRMIHSLLDHLVRTLGVRQAAVFVAREPGGESFAMRGSVGLEQIDPSDPSPDWTFLSVLSEPNDAGAEKAKDSLFFTGWGEELERSMQQELGHDEIGKPSWHATITRMGLRYFFPCRSRNRVVAVLGLGRTAEGEFLWEEDAALVKTLTGYLAIAVENVSLLQSLVAKASQYERLQEFSENILESINVGLLAVDLDDRVEAANTPLKLISPIRLQGGCRDIQEDLRGKKLSEVLPEDLAEQLDHLRDDGGIHNIYRYRVENGNGEERVLNIAVAPLLSKNCDWIGRLIIFDDVTDHVGLEAQLAQAEKLSSVGLMAAGVAHEVNTPLTVISTQAQMLAKQLTPGDKSFKSLEKIISQTFRASEIVNSLLNFSRTKGSAFAPVEINKIISETMLLLDHQFKSARIQVESDLGASVPVISGNSDKLQQVFLNMFLNAKDAMPEGGRLRVATWAENSHIEIEISDTGIGIPAEQLHRIYDPFFTTKGSGRGTGLGLSVSYGIIHEHAGKIHVESLPGLGTRFRLEFPTSRKAVHA